MKRIVIPGLLLALGLFSSHPVLAGDGRFVLGAGVGASLPFAKNLSDELAVQGTDAPKPGYSFGVSLGRTFAENRWSLEAHFAAAFYPEFTYECPYDSFPGRLQHYDYGLILRRNLLPEGTAFQPSIGIGVGYGLTNLVSGGGKMGAFEAIAAGRIETRVADNVNLSLEGTYFAGLERKTYASPFLANYDTDVVRDHLGNPLRDRFDAFNVRIGITVFLKQRMPE